MSHVVTFVFYTQKHTLRSCKTRFQLGGMTTFKTCGDNQIEKTFCPNFPAVTVVFELHSNPGPEDIRVS